MPKIGVFPRDGWKVLGIGQLECVLYGVVCGMFYYVDNEKAMINKDDHQKRELLNCTYSLSRHILDIFGILFSLIYACRTNYFMHFMHLFIEHII